MIAQQWKYVILGFRRRIRRHFCTCTSCFVIVMLADTLFTVVVFVVCVHTAVLAAVYLYFYLCSMLLNFAILLVLSPCYRFYIYVALV